LVPLRHGKLIEARTDESYLSLRNVDPCHNCEPSTVGMLCRDGKRRFEVAMHEPREILLRAIYPGPVDVVARMVAVNAGILEFFVRHDPTLTFLVLRRSDCHDCNKVPFQRIVRVLHGNMTAKQDDGIDVRLIADICKKRVRVVSR